MTDLADAARARSLSIAAKALRVVACAGDEQELFDGVCELLTADAGYALAWVGLKSEEDDRVLVAASRGRAVAYMEGLDVRYSDTPRGRGPTGTACRTGQATVFNDAVADPRYGPWLEAGRRHGLAATAAFPLRAGETVVGALNVYADRPHAFDDAEHALLEDVARGVSLGTSRAHEHRARARALEELETARRELLAIFDATPDMIFVHDATGRLLDVNETTERFYGVDAETMKSAHPERWMGEGHTLDEAMAHVRRALEEGAVEFPWVGRTAEGHTFPCSVSLRRLPGELHDDGSPAVVAVARDLTTQAKMQDELVERQRLESLAVLVRGLAHDFNNHLADILGHLDLARNAVDPSAEAVRALGDAERAARAARELVTKLRGFARGGTTPREAIDLTALARERVTACEEPARVSLIAPDGEVWIEGERTLLGQVIDGLLANALEGAPDSAVKLRLGHAAQAATLEVTDDGPGVPRAVRRRVFEPFFTTKPGSSGLGLSLAYGIVRHHGGELELMERGDDDGATFRVTLPWGAPPEQASEVQAAAAATTAGARRAIVMDDQARLRTLFERMLGHLGFEVATASNGDAALDACRDALEAGKPFTLALLDLTIPNGRGGHEILDELRTLDPALKILAATGYAETDARAPAFDAFLPKPFSLADLEAALAEFFPPATE